MLLHRLTDVFVKPDAEQLGRELLAELDQRQPSFKKVKEYLRRGASLAVKNKDGNAALHLAIQLTRIESEHIIIGGSDHREIIAEILKYAPPINARNSDGETALMMAVDELCVWAIRDLLDHNADVFVKDDKGRTALEYATSHSSRVLNNLAKSMPGFAFLDINNDLPESARVEKIILDARAVQAKEQDRIISPPKSGAPF